MDYEKKYKEALERAREWYNKTEPDSYTCIVESIFPELKESEDEKIRKELVNYFTEGREFLSLCSFGRDKILAWLEKQGEKPADKKEPKFKVGNTIKYVGERKELAADKYTIKEICNDCYITTCGSKIPFRMQEYYVIVNDAKGLKKIENEHICELDNSYTCVKFPFKAKVKSSGTIVTIHNGQLSSDGKEWIKYQSGAEDGYKIYEPNNLELVCEIKQNSAWSKEDEELLKCSLYNLREIEQRFGAAYGEVGKCIAWIQSLKQRRN